MARKKSDYWRDIIDSLRPPPIKYELVTDPKTGNTTRVEVPEVFVPIDFK